MTSSAMGKIGNEDDTFLWPFEFEALWNSLETVGFVGLELWRQMNGSRCFAPGHHEGRPREMGDMPILKRWREKDNWEGGMGK